MTKWVGARVERTEDQVEELYGLTVVVHRRRDRSQDTSL